MYPQGDGYYTLSFLIIFCLICLLSSVLIIKCNEDPEPISSYLPCIEVYKNGIPVVVSGFDSIKVKKLYYDMRITPGFGGIETYNFKTDLLKTEIF